MFEISSDTRARDAIRASHVERSKAITSAFGRLFGRRS